MPKQIKYIRIDLLEPLPETHPMATPDDATQELYDFLLNEFNNQGISAQISVVTEWEQ
jgi:hypothetical protein